MLVCFSKLCFIYFFSVLQKGFTIGIFIGNEWWHSYPIYLLAADAKAGSTGKHPQPYIELAEEGTVIIKFMTTSGVSKFQLFSTVENGVRCMILSPSYVVCNHTGVPLSAWTFCMLQKKPKRSPLNMPGGNMVSGSIAVPPQEPKRSPRGIGITTFFNLSYDATDQDPTKLFNYYLAVRIGQGEYSQPIPLNMPIARMSFSIQNDTEYVSMICFSIK